MREKISKTLENIKPQKISKKNHQKRENQKHQENCQKIVQISLKKTV